MTEARRAGAIVVGAIDPGLDRVSLAVFRYEIGPRDRWRFAGIVDKARSFVCVDHVTTSAKLELGERLELVARGTHAMLRKHGVERLFIERPAIAGVYKRLQDDHASGGNVLGGKIQASLQLTHYASGAIIASARTVLGSRVALIPAQRGKKAQRLETVRTALVAARIRETVKNSDDLDAVGIGLGAEWPY